MFVPRQHLQEFLMTRGVLALPKADQILLQRLVGRGDQGDVVVAAKQKQNQREDKRKDKRERFHGGPPGYRVGYGWGAATGNRQNIIGDGAVKYRLFIPSCHRILSHAKTRRLFVSREGAKLFYPQIAQMNADSVGRHVLPLCGNSCRRMKGAMSVAVRLLRGLCGLRG